MNKLVSEKQKDLINLSFHSFSIRDRDAELFDLNKELADIRKRLNSVALYAETLFLAGLEKLFAPN